MCRNVTVAACCLAILAGCPAGVAASEVDPQAVKRLVSGILARSQSLVSGRLEYVLSSGPPGALVPQETMLSFSGTSWAVRRPKTDGYLVSHAGKHVYFYRTPQPGGWSNDSAVVSHEKPIDEHHPSPPTFAGTFWYTRTPEFIRATKQQPVHRGRKPVNGVEAEVLEWDIPKGDAIAFYETGANTLDGGILRVFVSAGHGHALPRVEVVGRNGVVDVAYDGSEFFEAGGLFLPTRCRQTVYQQGKPVFVVDYHITKADLVNDAIPGEDFVLALPPGTSIQDTREPNGSVFYKVGQDQPVPPDLADVVAVVDSSAWRSWRVAAAVGGVVGGVVAVLGVCWARRRGAS